MSWPSTTAFFEMGGYGLYVWGSYAVTFIALALEVWVLRRRGKAVSNGETEGAGR